MERDMRNIIAPLFFIVLAGCAAAYPQEKGRYQLIGKVLQGNGKVFHGVTPVAYLNGTLMPFVERTLVGPDGKFEFKNLRKGIFTLTVMVPRVGELSKTVDVGPSFADSKGAIQTTMQFGVDAVSELSHEITVTELSIPEGARKEYRKAQDRIEHGDVQGAVVHLKKTVEIAPQFSAAWNHLGTIAHQAKQYAKAEEYFQEALNCAPDSYLPLVNLGGALLAQNKSAESLEINLLAIKTKPTDPLARTQLGFSYLQLGQLDEAERQLQRAIMLEPGHFSYPQLLLAIVYRRKMDIPAEIRVLEEFLRLHPDSDWVLTVRKELEQAKAKK
jgi:tetratricopeptide (TPR) repeat protein